MKYNKRNRSEAMYIYYVKYTRQKKKVGQLKNANISQKTCDIVDMHIFLKLIQFPIFWSNVLKYKVWVKWQATE